MPNNFAFAGRLSTLRYAWSRTALLDAEAVRIADANAIADGTTLEDLIERAGHAVAEVATEMNAERGTVAVLVGPGMNGRDALVAAHRLSKRHNVTVYQLTSSDRDVDTDTLSSRPIDEFEGSGYDLVIDGLFGTGLRHPLDRNCITVMERLAASDVAVLSIDVPSGICASTGAILGAAVRADRTVTFERRRVGHLLMPGRDHCGEIVVADIGFLGGVWNQVPAAADANEPELWLTELRTPSRGGHKYDRGHAVVLADALHRGGAARLSAMGALRGGAGLVTLAAPHRALDGLAAQSIAIMLRGCDHEGDLADLLEDDRFNAFVLGPGFGNFEKARAYAARIVEKGRALVLDADGITAFHERPDEFFALTKTSSSNVVLTPHAGEFARLFPEIAENGTASKLEKARAAAIRAGAVMVLKGADTVIAASDGRAAINATGTPWLATAGTGDVLAGVICAQLAQGTPCYEAACAGVWMHGRAAEHFGPGLISEDLPPTLPKVHAELDVLRNGRSKL